MSQFDLLSRQWCDLVFEGRNKDYGAYALRREAGRRYRRVAMIVCGVLLSLLAIGAVLGYFAYQKVREEMKAIEKEFVELKPKKEDDGYETKRLSRGRKASRGTTPGASNDRPEIADNVRATVSFGIDGPDDSKVEFDETLDDLDLDHNANQQDFELEGAQLVETDKVEEMPIFPGGIAAFRKYLDQEVNYSLSARRRNIEGTVEVSFVIEADGSVADIRIDKALDTALDRSVQNAIAKMPHWQAGKSQGRAVPVRVSIPVIFALD